MQCATSSAVGDDAFAKLEASLAAFIQARHVVFGCREFDDLLHAAHHAVAAKCVAAAPLLASARRLAAQS